MFTATQSLLVSVGRKTVKHQNQLVTYSVPDLVNVTDRAAALIYHGGGLIVGSSEIIPKPQVNYLASQGFVVVIPNYRLGPVSLVIISI